MKCLFLIDDPDTLKATKDSSIAMMRSAQDAGHEVWIATIEKLHWDEEVLVTADAISVAEDLQQHDWYKVIKRETKVLSFFSLAMMRKDPPVERAYIYATQLLSTAALRGVRVINEPASLRNWNEKLSILQFPELISPTLVATHALQLNQFIEMHDEVILKPLDGMGGRSIFRVNKSDPNRNVIIETLSSDMQYPVMAQRYIPEIKNGDKRILVIDGKAIDFALARIPQKGETRGNLAAGGRGVAQPLSERDRMIVETVMPFLQREGIFIAGLDVIGDYLTEINITSPTCMVEIAQQTGVDPAAIAIAALSNE